MRMDETTLIHRVWPAGFNRGECALSDVDDDAERLGDFAKKLRVCVDSFVFGPVPSNDVVASMKICS